MRRAPFIPPHKAKRLANALPKLDKRLAELYRLRGDEIASRVEFLIHQCRAVDGGVKREDVLAAVRSAVAEHKRRIMPGVL